MPRAIVIFATSIFFALLSAVLGATTAWAQSYPHRPIRLIVPFPPGGPVDTTARGIAPRLSELLKQPVVIENRAGAGGIVGADFAAKQPADGYTIFMCSIHHSVLPALRPKLPYDIERDFAPLSFGALFPIIVVAHPSVPAKSMAELTALAKTQPGKLSFSSAGSGGGTHLAGELYKSIAAIDIVHIPYKGSAPAMTDLLGGQVQLMFSDAPTALPHVRSGKVRALAVGSPRRSSLAPDVPTMAESGVRGYEAYSWAGFVVPVGTPSDIVTRLSAEIGRALSAADVRERLIAAGAEPAPNTPQQFARFIRAEMVKWERIIKDAGITAD